MRIELNVIGSMINHLKPIIHYISVAVFVSCENISSTKTLSTISIRTKNPPGSRKRCRLFTQMQTYFLLWRLVVEHTGCFHIPCVRSWHYRWLCEKMGCRPVESLHFRRPLCYEIHLSAWERKWKKNCIKKLTKTLGKRNENQINNIDSCIDFQICHISMHSSAS